MLASEGFSTLVSTDVLARHLDDADWVIVDCRFDLANLGWGLEEYERGHIAGAVVADLDRELSGTPTGRNGRHPLPNFEQLASTLAGWGIDAEVQVVAYDQDTGMYASRLWWLVRLLGHDRVALLDGGLEEWTRQGRPTVTGLASRPARRFEAALRLDRLVDMREVERTIGTGSTLLVDARAPERYEGRTEPLDPVAGHIPGAVNHFFQSNLGPDRRFQPADVLRDRFRRVLGNVAPDAVVSYCGSGVTACHTLLAMEHAGLTGARLYPGSWSEWCSDPGRPVETGPTQVGSCQLRRPDFRLTPDLL